MNPKLKSKIQESLSAVLPVTGIVLLLSIFLVPLEVGTIVIFLAGALMLVVGMGMFQLGAEMTMEPLGEGIGVQIAKSKSIMGTILFGVAMGILITVAEPDLQVLSEQVPAIPNIVLILTVALGVGLFLAAAILRILFKINLSYLLMGLYLVLMILSIFIPEEFLAVAFDSGGVTTGPITVPFIMALGIGLSSMRSDKNASDDSFGLVALSSVGPVLAVMILGLLYSPKDAVYTASELTAVSTMREVAHAFAVELPKYAKEVMISVLPILSMYVILQIKNRHHSRTQFLHIVIGFLYTYFGLVLFLCGVNVGFAPVGQALGQDIAASGYKWLLIPIGMLIGYFIVKAEPAIRILNKQVQNVTSGTISEKSMNVCLSIGVAFSVGLSMLRVITGIHIAWIVIPGYILALIMSRFVPKIFVGIAFDSGGVASGPMTSTFLLPLCIGACGALGGNLMTDAFGVVALVALTPLIAVQMMGLQYRRALRKREKDTVHENALPDDSDLIVEIEEE